MINTVFPCWNQDKVEIRHGSWFEPLEDLKGKLMGVISNPPYIPTNDLPGLQPEVGWHEPKLALDGGKDGLEHLLHLCEGLSSVLKPGGFFVFEVISISPFLKACYTSC
jgi:release factor glutamine methyltransferase